MGLVSRRTLSAAATARNLNTLPFSDETCVFSPPRRFATASPSIAPRPVYLTLTLPSDPARIADAEPLVNRLATAAQFGPADRDRLMLAATEAINNALLHGNKSNPEKIVTIDAAVDAGAVSVTVRDQGTGYNPDTLPDPLAPENLMKPGGRGVFLMRAVADEFAVETSPTGTTLRLVFYPHPDEQPPDEDATGD